MNVFNIPVSLGELLDKISILRIKMKRINDGAKLAYVQRELDCLLAASNYASSFRAYETYLNEFTKWNEIIWDCENAFRRPGVSDEEYLYTAKKCYAANDQRFAVKDRVNYDFGCDLREQKSHVRS